MDNNPMQSKLAMHRSPRCGARTRKGTACQSPATPKGRCRMHGGAQGSGAPTGERNGRYRHGTRTRETVAERKALMKFIREAGRFARQAVGGD
jgi:hypothetical protein